jgi:hypothetical protein
MNRDLQKITVEQREISLLQIARELFLIIFSGFFIGFIIWLEVEFGMTELLLNWFS